MCHSVLSLYILHLFFGASEKAVLCACGLLLIVVHILNYVNSFFYRSLFPIEEIKHIEKGLTVGPFAEHTFGVCIILDFCQLSNTQPIVGLLN